MQLASSQYCRYVAPGRMQQNHLTQQTFHTWVHPMLCMSSDRFLCFSFVESHLSQKPSLFIRDVNEILHSAAPCYKSPFSMFEPKEMAARCEAF